MLHYEIIGIFIVDIGILIILLCAINESIVLAKITLMHHKAQLTQTNTTAKYDQTHILNPRNINASQK